MGESGVQWVKFDEMRLGGTPTGMLMLIESMYSSIEGEDYLTIVDYPLGAPPWVEVQSISGNNIGIKLWAMADGQTKAEASSRGELTPAMRAIYGQIVDRLRALGWVVEDAGRDGQDPEDEGGPRKWDTLLTYDLYFNYGMKPRKVKDLIAGVYRQVVPTISDDELADIEKRVESTIDYWRRKGHRPP